MVSNRFGSDVGKDDVEESFVGCFLLWSIVLRRDHESEMVGDLPEDGHAIKSKAQSSSSQLARRRIEHASTGLRDELFEDEIVPGNSSNVELVAAFLSTVEESKDMVSFGEDGEEGRGDDETDGFFSPFSLNFRQSQGSSFLIMSWTSSVSRSRWKHSICCEKRRKDKSAQRVELVEERRRRERVELTLRV